MKSIDEMCYCCVLSGECELYNVGIAYNEPNTYLEVGNWMDP